MNTYANVFKYLDMCTGDFYSPKRIITYGRPWMFITGSRSVGKSTAIAILCILDYLVNGHKWIYVRRTKDEVGVTAHTFFGNAVAIINSCTEFKIHEILYKKQKFFISMENDRIESDDSEDDDKYEMRECGMVIPLSLEQKYKSSNLSDCFTIIYDEFIAKNSSQYLGTSASPEREYNAMLSLYQTVDRGIGRPYRNETMVFFLGNTATIYNPIYLSLSMPDSIKENSKVVAPKGKLWVLEQVEYVDAISGIEDAYGYRLGTEQERAYAYHNRGVESGDTAFIGECEIGTYDETFILGGTAYGICHDHEYRYYVGRPRFDITSKTYSLDIDSHTGVDLRLIHRMIQHPMTLWLHDAFAEGRLYFKDVRTKREWLKYLKYMP